MESSTLPEQTATATATATATTTRTATATETATERTDALLARLSAAREREDREFSSPQTDGGALHCPMCSLFCQDQAIFDTHVLRCPGSVFSTLSDGPGLGRLWEDVRQATAWMEGGGPDDGAATAATGPLHWPVMLEGEDRRVHFGIGIGNRDYEYDDGIFDYDEDEDDGTGYDYYDDDHLPHREAYDFLASLDDVVGVVVKTPRDLDRAAPLIPPGSHPAADTCAVCMEDLLGGDDAVPVRRLSECGHEFCSACIERWFTDHITCPICVRDVCSDHGGYSLVDSVVADPDVGAALTGAYNLMQLLR